MDISVIYIIGFVIYVIYSVFSGAKSAQKKGKARKPTQLPRQQAPQQRRQRKIQQRKTSGTKSLEEMLQEIYNETNTPKPAPVHQLPPPVKEEEVFTYDNDPSYNGKYETYDDHAHDREAQYEGEVYEKRKQKEIAEILYRRKNKIHLSGTMQSQKRVKKETNVKDFKFNARDAIIYDIIMNKPKF